MSAQAQLLALKIVRLDDKAFLEITLDQEASKKMSAVNASSKIQEYWYIFRDGLPAISNLGGLKQFPPAMNCPAD